MYMQRSIKDEGDRYVIIVKIFRPNKCNADPDLQYIDPGVLMTKIEKNVQLKFLFFYF
jgi:hypothetical protein